MGFLSINSTDGPSSYVRHVDNKSMMQTIGFLYDFPESTESLTLMCSDDVQDEGFLNASQESTANNHSFIPLYP